MRIRILSDLHLELGAYVAPAADADVVVLAGDIDNGVAAIDWARKSFNVPVLYVPGNHEYYDGYYQSVHSALHACAGGQLRLLDCDEWRHAGVRFLGCTLWSDFSLLEDGKRAAAMDVLRRYIPDYRTIGFDDRRFQPEDSAALCARHRAWLAAKLAAPFNGPTVVITHFVPHRGSIAPRFADNFANPAFIVPLDEHMGRAALWIHGHTHNAFDYTVNGTRIVSNPRGYPGEITGFVPGLVIDLALPKARE